MPEVVLALHFSTRPQVSKVKGRREGALKGERLRRLRRVRMKASKVSKVRTKASKGEDEGASKVSKGRMKEGGLEGFKE